MSVAIMRKKGEGEAQTREDIFVRFVLRLFTCNVPFCKQEVAPLTVINLFLLEIVSSF